MIAPNHPQEPCEQCRGQGEVGPVPTSTCPACGGTGCRTITKRDANALLQTWLYWREIHAETWREDHAAEVDKARDAIVNAMVRGCVRGICTQQAECEDARGCLG